LRNAKERKASWPVSRVLSRTAIHLGAWSPKRSSNLPRRRAGRAYAPLFDLAPGGVFPATPVTSRAVRSYRTISPLPGRCRPGGIFSAALSVGSRLPGITWHPALWSPDFPPPRLHGAAAVRPTLPAIIQKFKSKRGEEMQDGRNGRCTGKNEAFCSGTYRSAIASAIARILTLLILKRLALSFADLFFTFFAGMLQFGEDSQNVGGGQDADQFVVFHYWQRANAVFRHHSGGFG